MRGLSSSSVWPFFGMSILLLSPSQSFNCQSISNSSCISFWGLGHGQNGEESFRKKICHGKKSESQMNTWAFMGVFGKDRCFVMVFCGQFVVNCMVNVVTKQRVFNR